MYRFNRCPRLLYGRLGSQPSVLGKVDQFQSPSQRQSHSSSRAGRVRLPLQVETNARSQNRIYGTSEPKACRPKRIVIGITGATGALFAVHMLKVLRDLGVETHLIMSKWALATLKYETSLTEYEIHALASRVYTAKDMSAPIASGSFIHDGMAVLPCSMKTLAAIRSGYCDDLISRAADVSIKENRKLMLAVRETPLSDIHLDNMLFLRRAGAIIFPPVPAFYTRPNSLDDIIMQSVGRMLDCFEIYTDDFARWNGFEKPKRGQARPMAEAEPMAAAM